MCCVPNSQFRVLLLRNDTCKSHQRDTLQSLGLCHLQVQRADMLGGYSLSLTCPQPEQGPASLLEVGDSGSSDVDELPQGDRLRQAHPPACFFSSLALSIGSSRSPAFFLNPLRHKLISHLPAGNLT